MNIYLCIYPCQTLSESRIHEITCGPSLVFSHQMILYDMWQCDMYIYCVTTNIFNYYIFNYSVQCYETGDIRLVILYENSLKKFTAEGRTGWDIGWSPCRADCWTPRPLAGLSPGSSPPHRWPRLACWSCSEISRHTLAHLQFREFLLQLTYNV